MRSFSHLLYTLGALALLLSLHLAGCVPVTDTADPKATVTLDYNDPEQRRLYDLQDHLSLDSLVYFLDSKDLELRYLAARAFGSVIYDSAVAPLTKLLLDPIDDVRAMAAYALGQQGSDRAQAALIQAFDARDTAGIYAQSNATILEALGKVGDTTVLNQLTNISTYLPTDTLLVRGQLLGLYRFATRKMTSPAAAALAVERATNPNWPPAVRLIAAHYLQRSDADLSGYSARLMSAISANPSRKLLLPLSRALGKTADPNALPTLIELASRNDQPLVQVEAIRGLTNFPYELVRETLLSAALSKDALVGESAANAIIDIGIAADASQYWRLAKDSIITTEASLTLYTAALRHMPSYLQDYRRYVNYELKTRFSESENVYEKARVLNALAQYPWNFRYLIEQVSLANELPVKTAAAEALNSIANQPDIVEYFKSSFPSVKAEYAIYLQAIMETSNPGLQAVAAQTLALRNWNFQTAYDHLDFLKLTKAQLTLPRDTETAYFIEDALAVLDKKYVANKATPSYNHPINWDIFRSLQPGLEAVIETSRGQIVIDLFEKDAPATVINFVQLIRTGFYNGKTFHRIVPGFVTQGGDPRGDGYGSLDYTIRSETPPLYYDQGGYVGMASAGRHTEGVQFFFTHQATPHLDGRYTIFGRVLEGMDVVVALRQGDEMRAKLR